MKLAEPQSRAVIGVADALLEQAFDHHRRRARERVRSFHLHLVGATSEEDRNSLLEFEFDLDDYYVVLQDVLADEEESKIEIYAQLLKALVQRAYPGRVRAHLLKAFRALSVADLQLLREICAATHATEMDPDTNSAMNQIRRLLSPEDPLVAASTQSLSAWGFVSLTQRRGGPWPAGLATYAAEVLGFPGPKV